jgi:hypothetical protein
MNSMQGVGVLVAISIVPVCTTCNWWNRRHCGECSGTGRSHHCEACSRIIRGDEFAYRFGGEEADAYYTHTTAECSGAHLTYELGKVLPFCEQEAEVA